MLLLVVPGKDFAVRQLPPKDVQSTAHCDVHLSLPCSLHPLQVILLSITYPAHLLSYTLHISSLTSIREEASNITGQRDAMIAYRRLRCLKMQLHRQLHLFIEKEAEEKYQKRSSAEGMDPPMSARRQRR